MLLCWTFVRFWSHIFAVVQNLDWVFAKLCPFSQQCSSGSTRRSMHAANRAVRLFRIMVLDPPCQTREKGEGNGCSNYWLSTRRLLQHAQFWFRFLALVTWLEKKCAQKRHACFAGASFYLWRNVTQNLHIYPAYLDQTRDSNTTANPMNPQSKRQKLPPTQRLLTLTREHRHIMCTVPIFVH